MALWGNTDLVYSDGTISVNFETKTAEGAVGVVTFTSAVSEGDFLTVGAGATFGYAAIIGVTSTTLSLASVDGFVAGITTVLAGASYAVSEEPLYTIGDAVYVAPEAKTASGGSKAATDYSTDITTGVFGVDEIEIGIANTATGDARLYAPPHTGWVGITTFEDMHGNLRVKHEVLVAGGINTTSDAADDALFPNT